MTLCVLYIRCYYMKLCWTLHVIGQKANIIIPIGLFSHVVSTGKARRTQTFTCDTDKIATDHELLVRGQVRLRIKDTMLGHENEMICTRAIRIGNNK